MDNNLQKFLLNLPDGQNILKAVEADQILATDPLTNNASQSEIIDLLYGNRVWATINNQTPIFGILPSFSAGGNMQAGMGWRLLTDRGNSTGGVAETDPLPQGTKATYKRVLINPNFVVTRVAGSLKHQLVEELNTGVEDGFALERESKLSEHAVYLNRRLLAPSTFPVSGYYVQGATTTAANPLFQTALSGRTAPTAAAAKITESRQLLRAPAKLYPYIYPGDQITLSTFGTTGGVHVLAKSDDDNEPVDGTVESSVTTANTYGVFTIAKVELDIKNNSTSYTAITLTQEARVADANTGVPGFNATVAYCASIRRRNVIHSLDDVSSADYQMQTASSDSTYAQARPRVYNIHQNNEAGTAYQDLSSTRRTVSNGLGGHFFDVDGAEALTTEMLSEMQTRINETGAAPNVIISTPSVLRRFGERIKGDSSNSPYRLEQTAGVIDRPANMDSGRIPRDGMNGANLTPRTLMGTWYDSTMAGVNGAHLFADLRIPPRFLASVTANAAVGSTTATDFVTFSEYAAPVYVLSTLGNDMINNLGIQVILKGRYYESNNPIVNNQLVADGAVVSMMELVARRMNVLGQINYISKNGTNTGQVGEPMMGIRSYPSKIT